MPRSKHFILGVVAKGDDHVRVTRGERYSVHGGTKESHEQVTDFVAEIDKEYVKDPPQTDGERRLIIRDAARKTGMIDKK